MDSYTVTNYREGFIWVAQIQSDDEKDGEIINIGVTRISQFNEDSGLQEQFWRVLLSNGDETLISDNYLDIHNVLYQISCAWSHWNTFKWI